MNSLANSAHSICNYCGSEYDAAHGNHICNVEELQTLLMQEQTMTDEPDERQIAKLEGRIKEVKKFWREHPNHQSGLSRQISS